MAKGGGSGRRAKKDAANNAARGGGVGGALEEAAVPPPAPVVEQAAPAKASAPTLEGAKAEWSDIKQLVLKEGDFRQATRRARSLWGSLTRAQAVAVVNLQPSATKKAAWEQMERVIDQHYYTYDKMGQVKRAADRAGDNFGGL